MISPLSTAAGSGSAAVERHEGLRGLDDLGLEALRDRDLLDLLELDDFRFFFEDFDPRSCFSSTLTGGGSRATSAMSNPSGSFRAEK